jgi:Ca2+-transporting ATPase
LNEPHAAAIEEVAAALSTDLANGLTQAEAANRLLTQGPNEVRARHRPTPLSLLWEAVTEPFVVLLTAAGVAAVAVGEVRDGLLVLGGLLPIVGADFITSYRGERALEALKQSAAPTSNVRRGGAVSEVASAGIVPGDLVLLAVGDVVPADVRVSHSSALLIDRSALTGESVPEPASRDPDPVDAVLVERHSMAYSGTRVVQGRGEGIVIATGAQSQLGRIAESLGDLNRRRSPLQQELDRLVRLLLAVAIGLIVITSGLAIWRGEPIGVALLAGVASAIAAIPEEPPVLLAVVLGLGAYRLLRRGVLVRRLSAQETLSAVDLILTDKTGTLTQNRLALQAVLTPEGQLVHRDSQAKLLLLAVRAQDDAWHRSRGVRAGSFTRALHEALAGLGVSSELHEAELIDSRPASGPHPYTTTVSLNSGQREELMLGAPEAVLGLTDGRGRDLADWRALVERNASAGRRLLLLAQRRASRQFTVLALLAFADPLRADVVPALRMAGEAGIQTIVVTGDHPLTAARIAAGAGLSRGTGVTGDELASWDDARLATELPRLRIVARALPEHKLRLVEAARRAGRTVVVTGDGVNDAPALEHADVAVAMGSGTAVAREASDLVLGDDSFATLMEGLREGRRMVANIQKGLLFLISTHVGMLGFLLLATIVGFSQPLLPIHILWLEFFIDVSASVAFEREPEEPGLMTQPPRRRDAALLTRNLLLRMTAAGAWTAVGALLVLATYQGALDQARWMAFNVLVFGQVARAYANRSITVPVLKLRRNSVLLGVCALALVSQLAIPYVPALAEAFRATQLGIADLVVVVTIALAPAMLAEAIRGLAHRTWVA